MKKTAELFRALEATLAALAPLDPESRRRVIEAAHALVPIGAGTQGADRPAGKKGRAKPRRTRRA